MHIPPFFLPQLICNYIHLYIYICVCVCGNIQTSADVTANGLSPTIANDAGVPLSSLGKQLIPNYIYMCGNIQSSADVLP